VSEDTTLNSYFLFSFSVSYVGQEELDYLNYHMLVIDVLAVYIILFF